MSELNEFGAEVFDSTPVSCPIKFSRPTPLHLRIRQQILQAMKDMSSSEEYETEEEANDFELQDQPEFNSPYEMEADFDHISNPDPKENIPVNAEEKESSAEDAQIAKSSEAPEAE